MHLTEDIDDDKEFDRGRQGAPFPPLPIVHYVDHPIRAEPFNNQILDTLRSQTEQDCVEISALVTNYSIFNNLSI